MIKNVAFFGFADAKPETQLYKDAFETARVLAKEQYTIVNGGGPGVMDASTKGAESVNGETLAVTFNPTDAPGFEGRYVKNVVDHEIKTGNYIERMFKLMEHSHTFVIFQGGTGTISEFGTCWVLARLYYPHHKPFILYGEFWKEIMEVLSKNMKLRGNEEDVYRIVTSADEVVRAIKNFDSESVKIDHSKHCKECEGKAFMT